ncbi:MAG: SDR family NAD(P)-dependent oxidoreductase [Hyphomicrobiales bacterium]
MDLLLNNAGVGGPGRQAIGNIDYDAWAHVLDVNTLGPLRVSEAFVDNVASSDRKLIVTLTSGMGSIDDNTSGGAFAYRSSKAVVSWHAASPSISPRAASPASCSIRVQTDMGGPHGNQTPEESIAKMRRLIDSFGQKRFRQVPQSRRPRICVVGLSKLSAP